MFCGANKITEFRTFQLMAIRCCHTIPLVSKGLHTLSSKTCCVHAGAGMAVMRIAGMGDLLTADPDAACHTGGRCAAGAGSCSAVAMAEMDSYVIELDNDDMVEVLQVHRFINTPVL
jgi:hypothetical protein